MKLRETTFADFDQIGQLASRFGLARPNSFEDWSYLWVGNPLYRELEGTWKIGWVLEDVNGRIVGSIENIPLLYEMAAKRVLVATGRAWVAEMEYRSAALLLLDYVINQPKIDLYLNSTFSPSSTPAVSVFQCSRVPVGVWDEAAFWVTHSQGFVQSYLARKNYPFARALSYPLSAAVSLGGRIGKKRLPGDSTDVRECSGFDAGFDDFWQELKRRNPDVLLAVRTREILAWHYNYALLRGRLWIATVVDGSRIVAYAVFERRDKNDIGLSRVRLVDYQSLDQSPRLLAPILAWALTKCRAEGIHVLETYGRWLGKGEFLGVFAPYRRRLPSWRYVYRANTAELAERLKDPRAWAPSLFDGDASLTV